jgi:uncharacterized protein YndB with AHSA1/START domain
MEPEPQPAASNPMWMTIVGWFFSVLSGLSMIASGVLKLIGFKPEGAPELGWSDSSALGLGIVEIGTAVLFLIPRTAGLGAILLTGYLGGALASHLRVGDGFVIPIAMGAIIWFGLNMRDHRLRAVLPWRGDPSVPTTGGFLAACGKILLTLAALVAVIAALIVAQPTEFRIARSITIDAPPAKVFEHVNDFHKWDAWSPWKELDPNASTTHEGSPAGAGAVFKWSGNNAIGEGSMTITESTPNNQVKLKLEFVRPFPDTADVVFTFKADGEKTIVTWSMTGERNLLGKAVCSVMSMQSMVGGSYEKGLKNLKGVVEGKK